ncbi:MAG: glycosyltransferase [Rhodospirillales bacterium]|nr:glycosyltransferase [Rhodospirillales bacterium]
MPQTVAIFLNQCLPLSEIFVRHQAEALKGFSPKLVACRRVTPSVAGEALPQVFLNKTNSKMEKIRELLFKLTLRSRVLEEAVRECDLIHAHFGPTGWLASGLAQRTGKPLIVTCHGFDVLKNDISLRHDGMLQKMYSMNRAALAQRAAKFICVSEYIKKRAIAFGFPEEKCVVHYMGIPLVPHETPRPSSRPPEGPMRLIAVGRLVPFKGHARLIEAVAEVERRGYPVELHIVGGGELRDFLEAQAARSLKQYKFWGGQPHEKVVSLMRESDIFCHTSLHMSNGQTEAFGLVLLEAQWAGLPVVAFDSGGVPEAMAVGQTGLLAPEGDVKAFADALCRLMDDPVLLDNFAKAAPQFVQQNFDSRTQTAKLEDHYRDVL